MPGRLVGGGPDRQDSVWADHRPAAGQSGRPCSPRPQHCWEGVCVGGVEGRCACLTVSVSLLCVCVCLRHADYE